MKLTVIGYLTNPVVGSDAKLWEMAEKKKGEQNSIDSHPATHLG